MSQFDVYRNLDRKTAKAIPYLLDVQSDLLDILVTRIVIPLIPVTDVKKLARYLNPVFKIEDIQVAMWTPEMAGIGSERLLEKVTNLASHRPEIIQALDFVFTGV